MTFEMNDIAVKVKGGVLTLKTGLVVEETVCKMPVKLVPDIKWEKEVKKLIVSALIQAEEYETIALLKKKKN